MITVYGSHGTILADDDGWVQGFELNDGYCTECDSYDDQRIVKVDVAEYVAHYGHPLDAADILDVGFWDVNNATRERLRYEPPEPYFRAEIARGSAVLVID